MTLLQATFPYRPPVTERELIALNDVREVYGIRLVKFDKGRETITVEYDASRLKRSDLVFILRTAGIRIEDFLDRVA
jgi:hypothetical protein